MKKTILKKSLKKINNNNNNNTIKNKKFKNSKKYKKVKDKQKFNRKIINGGSIINTIKSYVSEYQGKTIPLNTDDDPFIQHPLRNNENYTSNHGIY